ncbi:Chemotaxis protein CheY [bioreactor metagenome]|uniref:Chemotaxis protein CheY n=1 Tax=bioreactor metagenome TaxID=1076179 RepID=A0A644TLN9_9ZZZZ|nr:response regulator [Negativicutes bacterium]
MARIMIVEDSRMMRQNLRIMLEKAGHTIVAEAGDGLQAFHEYSVHKPDLVTMDLTMPGISGIDTVQNIIAEFPNANIIVVSVLNGRASVIQAIANGARHYIIKPISSEKLLSVVNEVLVKYQARED